MYRTKPPRYEYECAHTCFTFYLNLELSLALGLNFPSPFGLPMLRRLFGKVVIKSVPLRNTLPTRLLFLEGAGNAYA